MRITSVSIPPFLLNNGLEEIRMNKLGNIVILAGKNGSGKSRILNTLMKIFKEKPTVEKIHEVELKIEDSKKRLEDIEFRLQELDIELEKKSNSDPTILKRIKEIDERTREQLIANKDNHTRIIQESSRVLNWNFIETSDHSKYYNIIPFVPKKLILADSNNFTKSGLQRAAKETEQGGIDKLPDGALAKIQLVQNIWFNATHQSSTLPEKDKEKAVKEYKKLKELIRLFLNTELDRDSNDDATLFGFPLGEAKLSDGQIIIIQFCLAIYSQEASLRDLILIMDEPENHLHPSIVIETIDAILKFLTNGQLWIATHSVPILAHFDPNLIWYVEKNKVSYGGNIPEKVLTSLLGNEDEIGRLQDFISLPSLFALNRHAFECLFEPTAVMTNSNDPQTLQIRKDLLKLCRNNKLNVLDYGAGKGRLLANIYDGIRESEKFIEEFNYIAFDRFEDDKGVCITQIERVYGENRNRYFNEFDKLFSYYDEGSFDVVILCNVFHEIDPKEWLILFGNNGWITKALNNNGVLIIVEDMHMPIGEKAYPKGFIVFDTPQIKELFKIKSIDKSFVMNDIKYDGRLKSHIIPKKYLEQISAESRISALRSLNKVAQEHVLSIRTKEKTYKNGKLHGFWLQQFANSSLALSELTGS